VCDVEENPDDRSMMDIRNAAGATLDLAT